MNITVSTDSPADVPWPQSIWSYLLIAFALQVTIRYLLAVMRNLEYHCPGKDRDVLIATSPAHALHGFWWNVALDFSGFHPERAQRDWLEAFVLGVIELIVFPILIYARHWEMIGVWIGLKAVPHWKQWLTHESYVRFFVGNGMVIIGSYVLARYFYLI